MPSSRWRRGLIRLLAIAVTVLLSGAGWQVLHHRPPILLTANGHRIDDPMATLQTGERKVLDLVASRHGVRANDTRCYYTTTDLSSPYPVPVTLQIACGPVLFIDGDNSQPYLTFPLSAIPASGGRVRLTVSGDADQTLISGDSPGRRLVRPDSLQPPGGIDGAGGLILPPAPPAVTDVLTHTSRIGSNITSASPSAVMIGPRSGVRLLKYGFVQRYGTGDAARSAPHGKRLLAFQVQPMPGDLAYLPPQLSVRVGGGLERGPLIITNDYVVTAVPATAPSVDLVLTDGGVSQSLSLLTGEPGSSNPLIESRTKLTANVATSKKVTVRVKAAHGAAGLISGVMTISGVRLSYWGGDGSHASTPDRALLHVMATVKLTGDKQGYGVESGLLSVTPIGMGSAIARNAAADKNSQVDDVVDVPASITSGTISFSGTVTNSSGSMTVITPVNVAFTIPAS
ncbi:MAG TPA: hypothetical protein VGH11_01630 [Jatrophihabitans sp.]